MINYNCRTLSKFFLFSSVLSVFCSCNDLSESKSNEISNPVISDAKRIDSLTTEKKKKIEYQFSMVEANLPAPFSIVNDIYNYNLPYKSELLNNPSNIIKYTSDFSKEINYGIYGLEMGYISFYGQGKDLVEYYNSTKKLSQQLNVTKIFDQFSDRFKTNIDNKDSIIVLVDAIYGQTDDYLKKNDRYLVASHVLAGALIELNYISLNLLKGLKQTPENRPLFEKIFNENLYISYLEKLYSNFNDPDSKNLLNSMTEYRMSFHQIIHTTEDMTPEHVNKVIDLVTNMRNKLIK